MAAQQSAELPGLELCCTLEGHTEPRIWHVAWSPSGGSLASCGEDRTIRLWTPHANEAEWRCVALLEDGHQRTIRWCAWSPCATYLASCSFDGTASVWECLHGEFDCVASLEGHENEVKSVAWSPSGQLLATCGRDKSVFIWEAEDEAYEVAAVLHSHAGDVKSVAWHPTKDVLASASYDDTVKLFKQGGDDWRCATTLTGHSSTVWALAFSEDGSLLASCGDDRSVHLWRDTTGAADFEQAQKLEDVASRSLYAMDWGRGEARDLVAIGSGDNSVSLLRLAAAGDGGGVPTLERAGRQAVAHCSDVNSVAWRGGAKAAAAAEGAAPRACLATAGDDGCVRLWRAPTILA
jgi:WD40 repeat protein